MMDLSKAEHDLIEVMQQIAKLDTGTMNPDTYIRLTKLKIRALTLVERIEAGHKARHERTVRKVRKAREVNRMAYAFHG